MFVKRDELKEQLSFQAMKKSQIQHYQHQMLRERRKIQFFGSQHFKPK